jgi:hypothetical protein
LWGAGAKQMAFVVEEQTMMGCGIS